MTQNLSSAAIVIGALRVKLTSKTRSLCASRFMDKLLDRIATGLDKKI